MQAELLRGLTAKPSPRRQGASKAVALLALALLLTGCSTVRLVDSDVSAFPTAVVQNVPVPSTYRFERLPSQVAQGQSRGELEALAQPELAKVGLQRDDAAPQYSVQLDVRIGRDPRAPWDDPRYMSGFFAPYPVFTRYGTVWRAPPLSMQFDFPYYRREVHVVVRRLADGQVVFESRANHDGRWHDDDKVLPAMFQATLQGFPNPPQGPRHIVVEIQR